MQKLNIDDRVKIVDTNDIWEGKEAVVLDNSAEPLITKNDVDLTPIIVKVLFIVDDEPKWIIQTFPANNLILQAQNESLNESASEKDYIKPFVCYDNLDDEKTYSWFMINRIAEAEDKSVNEVEEFAKKNNYKLYTLTSRNKKILIVAHPNCSIEKIIDDCDGWLDDVNIKEEK